MAARMLDGTAVANADPRRGRARRSPRSRRAPAVRRGSAIVLVGDDPASEIYVREQAEVGGRDRAARRSRAAAGDGVARPSCSRVVERLNRSDVHDGILVQSPLPAAMGADAERRVFDAIDPDKDVDGFHPINVGRLVQNRATLVACTPSGVIELLERSNVADRRRARRRHRPQRHRRQADGAAAAASPRDGDDLSLAHRRSAARRARGRHPRRRDRPAGVRDARRSSSRARRWSTSARRR